MPTAAVQMQKAGPVLPMVSEVTVQPADDAEGTGGGFGGDVVFGVGERIGAALQAPTHTATVARSSTNRVIEALPPEQRHPTPSALAVASQ